MPRGIVVETTEPTSAIRKRLADAWRKYLPKVRLIEVSRCRARGGKIYDPLPRKVRLEYTTEDGDAEAFLLANIDDALELAREDARGARRRYAFIIFGDPHPQYGNQSSLVDPIEEFIDGTDTPETKESEAVGLLSAARSQVEQSAAAQVRTMNAAATMMEKFCTLAEKVMQPRGEAAVAEQNAIVRMTEIGNQLQLDLAELAQSDRRSQRRQDMWMYLFKAFGLGEMDLGSVFMGGDFGGATDTSSSTPPNGTPPPNGAPTNGAAHGSNGASNGASSSSSAGASNTRRGAGHASAEEIGRIFASKPQIAALIVRVHDTGDQAALAELRALYKTAFSFKEAVATVQRSAGILGVARAIAFGRWMQSLGLKAESVQA